MGSYIWGLADVKGSGPGLYSIGPNFLTKGKSLPNI